MPTTLQRALLVAAAAALSLAACGDDDGDDGGGDIPAGAIVVDGGDTLSFSPNAVDAPPGEIVLALENSGSLPHTLVIEGFEDDLKLSVSGSGDTDSGSIELEPGDYVFYCDVAGHRGGGMEGTLTVG
jgi:plastocyanin